jgi:hypothetical protein
MSFAMFWVIAMGIGVVGFGWFKMRRRRKAVDDPSATSVTKAA